LRKRNLRENRKLRLFPAGQKKPGLVTNPGVDAKPWSRADASPIAIVAQKGRGVKMPVAISKEVTLTEFVEVRIGDIFLEVAELVGGMELSRDEAGAVAFGIFKAEMHLKRAWREFVDKKGEVE
jgi:hypothetical protein